MDVFKIIGIAFIGVVAVVILKNVKAELAVFASLAAGAVILLLVAPKLVTALDAFGSIAEKSKLSIGVYDSVIRIIGIGYITEYATGICNDNSCESIGKKVQFAGKVIIFIMALPILSEVIKTLEVIIG